MASSTRFFAARRIERPLRPIAAEGGADLPEDDRQEGEGRHGERDLPVHRANLLSWARRGPREMNDTQLALVGFGVLTGVILLVGRKLVTRPDDDVKAIRVPPSMSAALAALERGNVRAARAIAGVLGSSGHPAPEIELVLGRCDEEDGAFAEAAAHFERGPQPGARFAEEAKHRRAFCLALSGRWDAAEALLDLSAPAADASALRAAALILASRRDGTALAELVRSSHGTVATLAARDRRLLRVFDPRLVLPGADAPVMPEDAAWVDRVAAAARART